jgi:thioredoxin 2
VAAGVPHCAGCGNPLPWIADATANDFMEVAERSPLPVLVDFWAPWCGPCRVVSPAVERIAQRFAGLLKVVKVNTDSSPELGARFGVYGIPTLVLLRSGRELDRVTGARPEEALQEWVQAKLPLAESA